MTATTTATTTEVTIKSSSSTASSTRIDNSNNPVSNNHVDYAKEGGPSLTVLWSKGEPLVGQTLYLGGEVGCDDKIYCIPGHAPRVLRIDPLTNDVHPVGPVLSGKFKWLRGVRCNDVIYGLPCHKDTVLRIHVPTLTVTELPIPYHDFYDDPTEAQQQRDMEWKYHGGATSPIDSCIYTIPQSAWHVLKIDPTTDTCTFVDSQPLKGRCKWYGGVVGKQDGAIYGIPHNSSSILRIDPLQQQTNTVVTLHGDFGPGGHKWHGAAAAPNGTIVSVPANADSVLCVTPARPEPILYELGNSDIIQTGRHRSDGKYKFLGAMTGTDGKVYCFPCASERVLQIDTVTNHVRSVGPNLYDTQMERIMQNKWQNGLTSTSEQCTYAIPLAADTLLKIDTSTDEPVVTTYKLPETCHGLAKWEGGVVAPNGVIYTCPNNFKGVLRIAPCGVKSENSDAINKQPGEAKDDTSSPQFLYTTGIATLRSSAHRVKHPLKDRKHDPKPKDECGNDTNKTFLPRDICKEVVFPYDNTVYDFSSAMVELLRSCDSNMVGTFPSNGDDSTPCRLEDFVVPPLSLSRADYGGCCEQAQVYFSNAVATNDAFLALFDRFVLEVVLPQLKARLVEHVAFNQMEQVEFYYQRPPTVRLQPGPARADVKSHNDAEYGHQNGELNFWLPLTDRKATGVDLWCESSYKQGDYHPLEVSYGEVASFHGSSCRHYVNANHSDKTRVSCDFRVGVQGFFDSQWQMAGTTDDHFRRVVRL